MTTLLKGKPVAEALMESVQKRVESLKALGIEPAVAFIRVGNREDDLSYERSAEKRLSSVGILVHKFVLDPEVSTEDVIGIIRKINEDLTIHGCLIFRPLPETLDEGAICEALSPSKDIDGITAGSLYGVYADRDQGFAPCTAESCLRLLDFYAINPAGKKATVIGRSLVIGKPVASMLQRRNATVTVAHSWTANLGEACRNGDIIVAALGCGGFITAEHLRPGQTVLDVGMNWDEDAEKFVGDVDFDAANGLVEALTPVPGGVGALTTAVLALHSVEAAERQNLRSE